MMRLKVACLSSKRQSSSLEINRTILPIFHRSFRTVGFIARRWLCSVHEPSEPHTQAFCLRSRRIAIRALGNPHGDDDAQPNGFNEAHVGQARSGGALRPFVKAV